MNSSEPRSQKMDSSGIMTDDPATAIYTAFAKVYTMNPNNKTFWLPSSSSTVPVSFYFDKHRSVYRIISYDKKDLVVNSTVFPSMTFIKTSCTFGLWSDTKLRTIYGLGFTSNENLLQFTDWFEKIVKAAKTLEDNLPLPPPAPSAVSLGCDENSIKINPNCIRPPDPELQCHSNSGTTIGSSSSIWFNDTDGHGNRNYDPPKTVHVVDSNIQLSPSNRGDGDYEVVQMGTSPMEKLALENLQYQREVLKVKQLEIELHSLRSTVNNMHEGLQRKVLECDKIKKELAEAKDATEELKTQIKTKEDQIAKLQESEALLKEETEDFKIQLQEREQILSDKKEEIKYLKTEVEKAEDIKKENDILKERLRQLQTEFDISDKNWDIVEMAACDVSGLIQGLCGVHERLKQVIPTPSTGDL